MRVWRAAPLLLALCALALPAAARADEQLTATGSLTLAFAGDPARGCAAEGLCSVRGTITVDAQSGFYTSESGPPHERFPAIIDISASGTARVQTAAPPGAPGSCVDVLPMSDLQFALRSGKRPARFILGGGNGISSGVCAGPLEGDLDKLTIPIRVVARQHPSFDLRTRKAFSAGPFSGVLVSTLVLSPDLQSGFSSSSSSSGTGSGSSPRRPSRTEFVEQVAMRYRVAAVTGALQESFSGAPDPFCQVLDACGVSGTVDLSLVRQAPYINLSASRIVRRRVGRARAIADLRAGKFRLGFFFGGPARVAVAEKLRRGGATICQDVHTVSTQLAFRPVLSGLELSLGSPLFGAPGDAPRTHCPGPSNADVFGPGQGSANGGLSAFGALARATIGLAQLGAPSIVVALTRGGTFSGLGYSGSRGGAVALTFARARLHAGTIRRTIR